MNNYFIHKKYISFLILVCLIISIFLIFRVILVKQVMKPLGRNEEKAKVKRDHIFLVAQPHVYFNACIVHTCSTHMYSNTVIVLV